MEHDPDSIFDIDAKKETGDAYWQRQAKIDELQAQAKVNAIVDRIFTRYGRVGGLLVISAGIAWYYVETYALEFLAILAVFAVAYMALVATAGAQTPDTWWIDALRDKNVSEATINAIIEELYRAGSEIENLDEKLAECEQAVIIEKYRNK